MTTEHVHTPAVEPSLREIPLEWGYLARLPALALIRLYQMSLSRVIGGACRFYPTCSHYAYQAIFKFGLLKGGLMAAWRLLRCQPFVRGGYDPVP